MTTIPQAWQTAQGFYHSRQFEQAERVCREILEAEPGHAPAWHLWGVIEHQRGHHASAIEKIGEAVRLDASEPGYHINLGEAHREAGHAEAAKACYQTAIERWPQLPNPHANLAMVYKGQKDWSAAAEHFRRALAIKPDAWDVHCLLGEVLEQAGDVAAARQCYEIAMRGDPNYFEAIINLGKLERRCRAYTTASRVLRRALQVRPNAANVCLLLGDVEADQQNWAQAVDWYQKALKLSPEYAAAAAHLATALHAQGQVEAAMSHYEQALRLAPGDVTARYNLATALMQQNRAEEAVAEYRAVLEIHADHPGALTNLGAYYEKCGDFAQALSCYDRLLVRRPDVAEARYGRALIRLAQADFAGGWEDFEWRLKLRDFPVLQTSAPRWDGRPLSRKTLLLHAEQGLGDTLQFVRYLGWVRERCDRVILQVQTPLVPLLRAAGIENVVGREEPTPDFDVQLPLLSLPHAARTEMSTIPATIPYLAVEPQRIAFWAERLGRHAEFRVGICWKGCSKHGADAQRSIPLAQFEPLARIANVRLISLQKREGMEQLRDVAFEVTQLGEDWDESSGPFVDCAAVMKNLDLVVTADTATAHLAGALGVEVWVALPALCDWRWMLTGDTSPWYPTMRLFRQSNPGDWSGPLGDIAKALAERVASRSS